MIYQVIPNDQSACYGTKFLFANEDSQVIPLARAHARAINSSRYSVYRMLTSFKKVKIGDYNTESNGRL